MDGEVHQSLLLTRAGEDHRVTVTGWLCDLTLLVALTILMALLYCPNVALSHTRIYSKTVLEKHSLLPVGRYINLDPYFTGLLIS